MRFVERTLGAEPGKKRASNDAVVISLGAGSEVQGIGSKSAIKAAAPDAEANAAITKAILAENEMLQPDQSLPAVAATSPIHPPPGSAANIMGAQVRHNLGKRQP